MIKRDGRGIKSSCRRKIVLFVAGRLPGGKNGEIIGMRFCIVARSVNGIKGEI